MYRKISFAFILAILVLANPLQAQTPTKYGHMNLGNLLDQLPSTQKANIDLKFLADKLTAKADSMGAAFQTAYTQLEKEYGEGTLTPVQLQARQDELQKQQEAITKYQETAQATLDAKRNELLTPILDEVEAAIKAVAEENGYLMIFDVSSGVMLYANESDDVTDKVKKKLGL